MAFLVELPATTLLAFNPIDPVVSLLHTAQVQIDGAIHNYGWTMILLAAIIKLCFWPLNTMQFKAMKKTQEIAPKLKALQVRYKNDKEKLNSETMALYKETGANPLAGCLPLLLQMPILISMYWSVITHRDTFVSQGWLWIGGAFAAATPVIQQEVLTPLKEAHPAYHLLGGNLASPDYALLALYIISMYFQVRFTSPPSSDPQQAQQQKIMAFISPVMVGFFGFKYAWPSALILYWLSFNVFTMAQQMYLIRKYSDPSAAEPPAAPPSKGSGSNGSSGKNGTPAAAAAAPQPALAGSGGGSRAARKRRSSRR